MIFSSSSLVCLLLTATFSPQRAIAAPLAESVSISAAIATPTQPYTAPTVSPTTALQLAVQKCATRMNEVLPPFIPVSFKLSSFPFVLFVFSVLGYPRLLEKRMLSSGVVLADWIQILWCVTSILRESGRGEFRPVLLNRA